MVTGARPMALRISISPCQYLHFGNSQPPNRQEADNIIAGQELGKLSFRWCHAWSLRSLLHAARISAR